MDVMSPYPQRRCMRAVKRAYHLPRPVFTYPALAPNYTTITHPHLPSKAAPPPQARLSPTSPVTRKTSLLNPSSS
jgi:hypothetical protein